MVTGVREAGEGDSFRYSHRGLMLDTIALVGGVVRRS